MTVATTRSCVVDDVDQLVIRVGPAHRCRAYHAPHEPSTSPGLREEANDLLTPTVELRRTLHEWPEVGNDLPVTQEHVLGRSRACRSTSRSTRRRAAIAALLTGAPPGPTILLRGDMDALPMHEDTGLDFASRVDATMHACGHDTHTAMLVGAAKLLPARRDDLAGRVLFMFQPGEEGHHGARFMLDEGLLDVPPLADGTPSPVTGAFAIHITSALPSGWLSSRGGSLMASADRLTITVTGKGGHASEPHRATDPIPVACEMVQALQTMVTRTRRRVRPVGRHRRADHRRHDEQRDPRDRRDRGHHPRRQREDPRPRSTTASAASSTASPPPTAARSRSTSSRATRSPSTTPTSPTSSSASPSRSSAPTRSCASRTR